MKLLLLPKIFSPFSEKQPADISGGLSRTVGVLVCALFLIACNERAAEQTPPEPAVEYPAEDSAEEPVEGGWPRNGEPDILDPDTPAGADRPPRETEGAGNIPRDGHPDWPRGDDIEPGAGSEEPFPETAAPDFPSHHQPPARPLDQYKVILRANEKIAMPGVPGELRVWIGDEAFEPDTVAGMVSDSATVPRVGESAQVEPYAPGFDVEPDRTQCIRIHPSGSEVRFKLRPKDSGTFEVGASVYLFASDDCSGTPIPRTAATLTVNVEVDEQAMILGKLGELWNVFWEKLLEFWGMALTLLFGLILFLLRKKLKQWFGYQEK